MLSAWLKTVASHAIRLRADCALILTFLKGHAKTLKCFPIAKVSLLLELLALNCCTCNSCCGKPASCKTNCAYSLIKSQTLLLNSQIIIMLTFLKAEHAPDTVCSNCATPCSRSLLRDVHHGRLDHITDHLPLCNAVQHAIWLSSW